MTKKKWQLFATGNSKNKIATKPQQQQRKHSVRKQNKPPIINGYGDQEVDYNKPPTINDNGEKEVDYYTNPTELFRWINFHRWKGATVCLESKPEAAKTWIISRKADNSILWRQLPLHLVSANSGINVQLGDHESNDSSNADRYALPPSPSAITLNTSNSNNRDPCNYNINDSSRKIEDLIDDLISTYPKAASIVDGRGMLPIHLCLEKISASVIPNIRVLNMLLLAHPTAIRVKDANGRTPMDIIIKKSKSMNTNDIDSMHSIDRATRIINRAQEMINALELAKIQYGQFTRNIQQSSDEERQASLKMTTRLETELAAQRLKCEEQSVLAFTSKQKN